MEIVYDYMYHRTQLKLDKHCFDPLDKNAIKYKIWSLFCSRYWKEGTRIDKLPQVPERLGRGVVRRDDCVERVVVGDGVAMRADVLVPRVSPGDNIKGHKG